MDENPVLMLLVRNIQLPLPAASRLIRLRTDGGAFTIPQMYNESLCTDKKW